MKVLILYRERSEHRQKVQEFVREFSNQHPSSKVEVMDIDQREGSATASIYDIYRYPSILALRDDGSVIQVWQGIDELPRTDDVGYYASGQI